MASCMHVALFPPQPMPALRRNGDELIDENPNMSKDEYENHRLVQRQADSYSLIEMQRLFEKYRIKVNISEKNMTTSIRML